MAYHSGALRLILPDLTIDLWWIKWQWSRFFSSHFVFALLAVILPLHYTHLSLPPEACDSPDQAEYCYIQSPLIGN